MSSTESVIVLPDGSLRFVWNDSLQPLVTLGVPSVKRASHVEPTENGEWTADMSPVSPGVVLGPFTLRSEALDAERLYLELNGY